MYKIKRIFIHSFIQKFVIFQGTPGPPGIRGNTGAPGFKVKESVIYFNKRDKAHFCVNSTFIVNIIMIYYFYNSL